MIDVTAPPLVTSNDISQKPLTLVISLCSTVDAASSNLFSCLFSFVVDPCAMKIIHASCDTYLQSWPPKKCPHISGRSSCSYEKVA